MNIKWFHTVLLLGLLWVSGGCDKDRPNPPDNPPDPPPKTCSLTVNVTGGGVVSSQPAGIQCGAQCQATFPCGESVRLTASMSSSTQIGRAHV